MPQGHWKTKIFIGALTLRGFVAPYALYRPINREAFEAFVEQVFCPELRPGGIVIVDSLSSYRGPRVRELPSALRRLEDRQRVTDAGPEAFDGALRRSGYVNPAVIEGYQAVGS